MQTRSSSLLVLAAGVLAACNGGGDDTGATGDTGTTDTGTVQEVTVEVLTADGQPAAGSTVVFHDAQGQVLGTGTTDTSGVATWQGFPQGGLVTAEVSLGATEALFTSGPVQPGDLVTMLPRLTNIPDAGEIDVELPGAHPEATTYGVTTCFGTGAGIPDPTTTQTLTVSELCLAADGEAHVLGLALDASGDPVAWALATDVAVGDTVDLGSWSDTGFRSMTLDIDAIPDEANSLTTTAWLGHEGIPLWYDDAITPDCSGDLDAGLTCELELIGDLSEFGYDLAIDASPPAGPALLTTWEQVDSVPGSLTVDVGSQVLERVHSPSVDASDRQIAWTAEGTLDEAEGSLLGVGWTLDGTDYVWIVQSDAELSSPYTLPELPASMDDRWSEDGDDYNAPLLGYFRDSRGSYADYRQRVLSREFTIDLVANAHRGSGAYEGAWTFAGSL